LNAVLVHQLDMSFFAPLGEVGHAVWIRMAMVEARLSVSRRKEMNVYIDLRGHVRGHFIEYCCGDGEFLEQITERWSWKE
jgi:hypothetical protein